MSNLFVYDGVTLVGGAAYPPLRISPGSVMEYVDDEVEDDVGNGPYRSRSLSGSVRRRFVLKHIDVLLSEATVFDVFYLENRNVSIAFTWTPTGQQFSCYFAKPIPKVTPNGGLTCTIDVTLREA